MELTVKNEKFCHVLMETGNHIVLSNLNEIGIIHHPYFQHDACWPSRNQGIFAPTSIYTPCQSTNQLEEMSVLQYSPPEVVPIIALDVLNSNGKSLLFALDRVWLMDEKRLEFDNRIWVFSRIRLHCPCIFYIPSVK